MRYSPKEDLHGGFYFEGQEYVHLKEKHLLEIRECLCGIRNETSD